MPRYERTADSRFNLVPIGSRSVSCDPTGSAPADRLVPTEGYSASANATICFR